MQQLAWWKDGQSVLRHSYSRVVSRTSLALMSVNVPTAVAVKKTLRHFISFGLLLLHNKPRCMFITTLTGSARLPTDLPAVVGTVSRVCD